METLPWCRGESHSHTTGVWGWRHHNILVGRISFELHTFLCLRSCQGISIYLQLVDLAKDSSRYGRNTHTDFCQIGNHLRYHNKNFSIFTTKVESDSHQIWRVWLKKCARHAHFHFELPKGMAVFLSELCPSNLVESWKLMSTTTGENLVSISQTTFE